MPSYLVWYHPSPGMALVFWEGALQIYLFLGVVMGLEDVVEDCCRFCLMFIPVVDWRCCRFHKLVTRCFCPTNTVAQRALKAGLQPYQLRVHGLPIRPSFSNPTRPKVVVVHHVIQSVCHWPCLMLFWHEVGCLGFFNASTHAFCYRMNCGKSLKWMKNFQPCFWWGVVKAWVLWKPLLEHWGRHCTMQTQESQ